MTASDLSGLVLPLRLPGVHLSAEEYVRLNFRLWRAQPKTRINQWLLGAAVLLLAVSVGLDLWQHGRLLRPSTLAFLGVAVAYALFRAGLVRYQLRRAYAQNASMQNPIDFELTAEGLRGTSSLGNFTSRWPQLRRAVWVRPEWLLLYPSEAACYYLDLRCLQAPATPADIEKLLTRQQVPQLNG
ncbi:hypothetical protein GCM10027346_10820 [Hymenobacter seoulensis]